ncbi:ferritin-like superfamily [Radiomyces spectabilis]|uniref:ferritin-like superfamily n=1 Tax=Radiomyces spectabilis TaxID=64574 RepID=UPI00221F5EC8|nr:ferritin-like superfamily [Radiomyces spectabilis]KAI8364659.1 ferritin-like superfamily [Radiomyces spectabilis]
MSLVKQNFASSCEEAINQQINTELQASQVYLSMAAWAGSSNVALPGFQKMWLESATEERTHAQWLIDYQNMRGGRVVLQTLYAPESDWKSAKNAVEAALQLEKDVNKSLLNMFKIAEENNDPQLADFISSKFLTEQVQAIKTLGDMVTQISRVGSDGLGLHLYDQSLLAGGSGAGNRNI